MTISRASLASILAQIDPTAYPQNTERLLEQVSFDPAAALEQKLAATKSAEISIESLLPSPQEIPDRSEWSVVTFLTSTLLRASLEAPKQSRRKSFTVSNSLEIASHLTVNGDLVIEEGGFLAVAGDLTVKDGRLLMGEGARLVVLGDMRVESDWVDETEWSSACIVGHLSIVCALFTSGDLYVGRDLYAPFIHAACSPGTLKVLGGIKAKMLIDDEHRDSAVFGPSDVAFAVVEELKGLDVPDDEVNLKNLRNILLFPEIVELHTSDFFEMTERIIEMVEEQKAIFSGDDPGWIFARA